LQTNWTEVAESFDDMNLREEVLRGIYGFGFEKVRVLFIVWP
jgi:translation initiation factor 4A